MKIALVHDYIKEYGGAERVLEALHELWPDAPVYTTVYLPEFLGPHKKRFQNWDIRTSWAQTIPFKAKLISPLRLLAPFLFQSFNFSNYDVIITSATGAYSPNILKKKKATLICYSHTPPRYLYGFATARNWKNNIFFRMIGEVANHILRIVDYNSSKHVDYFISNSENVRKRINKFYKKDATVIYPPVDITSVENITFQKQGYYVAGGRLARPKNIDLIITACTNLDVPLKIFGKAFAGYGAELKDLAGDNTEFVGEVSDSEKLELLKGAKAYIFASSDEDFGITPVEAMSVGTPVIAYRSGGVVESVIDTKTGIFFNTLSVRGIEKVLQEFDPKTINPMDCITQAKKFSKERFKKEIQRFIEKIATEQ